MRVDVGRTGMPGTADPRSYVKYGVGSTAYGLHRAVHEGETDIAAGMVLVYPSYILHVPAGEHARAPAPQLGRPESIAKANEETAPGGPTRHVPTEAHYLPAVMTYETHSHVPYILSPESPEQAKAAPHCKLSELQYNVHAPPPVAVDEPAHAH